MFNLEAEFFQKKNLKMFYLRMGWMKKEKHLILKSTQTCLGVYNQK